ncbi:MAG: T9SS type A sorting domain-containing protein [Bacteroidetes bacterium]|nr:T9SS type A sorting domain-containing protein [Bacteroidota bacterium]
MRITNQLRFIFIFLLLNGLLLTEANAQFSKHIIWLKNKGNNSFTLSDASSYLSARSIARRTRYTILLDSTDLPVTPAYIAAIRTIPGVTLLNVSKWLNALCIQTTSPMALTTIQNLPFVQQVAGLATRPSSSQPNRPDKFYDQLNISPIATTQSAVKTAGDFYNYGTNAGLEMKLHRAEFLHNIGLRGSGMHVALLDGGFYNYNTLPAFDSINRKGQVLSTWDFVAGNASVSEDHPHGMQCLSTIAANIPGQFIGKAPQASFHLFRTEDVNSEFPIEEFNWVCGAEKADSLGVDLISSSLGYYDFDNPVFNYTYAQLDGKTTIAVRGADLAAKKGLMVLNSAGNEGTGAWRYIITPADGDSVIAVGAVNAAGAVAGFSSYGPTADGRIKPELASVGWQAVVQSTSGTIGTANGTSFSCPNLAGLTTCLWQGFPEFNNVKILDALKRSASRYTNPNDRIGYGIPDMKNAFAYLLSEYATVTASINNCRAAISWRTKDVTGMQFLIERKLPGETSFQRIAQTTAASGSTLTNQTYKYQDVLSAINPGNIQYRITQVIDTASATRHLVYLDSTTVTLSSRCTTTDDVASLLWIYPNPTPGKTKAQLVINSMEASTGIKLTLHDRAGRLLATHALTKPAGIYRAELPFQPASSGVYTITLWIDDKKKESKNWVVSF